MHSLGVQLLPLSTRIYLAPPLATSLPLLLRELVILTIHLGNSRNWSAGLRSYLPSPLDTEYKGSCHKRDNQHSYPDAYSCFRP